MVTTDFLVIGSGIAGLLFALDVAEHGSVTVITKQDPTEGSTRYAQGGIASVISPLDSFQSHIEDTIACGAGLCNEEVVKNVIEEGPDAIAHLIELGTKFDIAVDESTGFELGQEGGHKVRRILHAGDATGAEIQRAIFERAKNHPRIELLSDHIAIDLITSEIGGEVHGAYVLDAHSGAIITFAARVTLLATGGAGKVYLYTSNPDVVTGDGIAMAYRAGAKVANMEFIQFHPTCLYHPEAKSFLISEALRGEGAVLLNGAGERFMGSYHEDMELAPRDVVARAIDDQMKRRGEDCVWLDISFRDAEFLQKRFPNIYEKTKTFGFDITKSPLPVVPAAHYTCGGVRTSSFGATSMKRLFAAGEVACTGLHGANRLASNSLLEAAVFSRRAARWVIENLTDYPTVAGVPEWDSMGAVQSEQEVLVSHTWDEVRRLMWNLVGIVRSDYRLRLAKKRIQNIQEEIREYYWRYKVTADLIELRNITLLAELIVLSALERRESRGLHYNVDCPSRDDEHFKKDTVVSI